MRIVETIDIELGFGNYSDRNNAIKNDNNKWDLNSIFQSQNLS
jgi:hypothetical protein